MSLEGQQCQAAHLVFLAGWVNVQEPITLQPLFVPASQGKPHNAR